MGRMSSGAWVRTGPCKGPCHVPRAGEAQARCLVPRPERALQSHGRTGAAPASECRCLAISFLRSFLLLQQLLSGTLHASLVSTALLLLLEKHLLPRQGSCFLVLSVEALAHPKETVGVTFHIPRSGLVQPARSRVSALLRVPPALYIRPFALLSPPLLLITRNGCLHLHASLGGGSGQGQCRDGSRTYLLLGLGGCPRAPQRGAPRTPFPLAEARGRRSGRAQTVYAT